MSTELLRILAVASVASSIAMLLVLLLRRPMRSRFGAQAAYAIWCMVPLSAAMALLPAPAVVLAPVARGAAVTPVLLQMAAATPPAWHFNPAPWIGGAWLLGAIASMTLLMLQQRRFLRALGRLSSVAGQVVRAEASAGCPALVGAWRPRIVVPADFDERFTAVERALILAHEQLHRTRGDAQVNLLVAAVRCLFWFNPIVHIAASRFRFDQELACDALVLARFPEARRPYADAMLKTQLAGESRQELGLPVGCYWQSSHPLKERISMLKQPLPGRARSALGLAIAAAMAIGGSYAAWAAQPAQVAHSVGTIGPIRAELTLSIDGIPLDASWRSHTTSVSIMQRDPAAPAMWRFGLRAGEPFSLAVDRASERWQLDGATTPNADGTISLDSVLKHNDAVVATPKLIVRDGEPAGVKVGDQAADGAFKGFGAQITLARVGDKDATPAAAAAKATNAHAVAPASSDAKASYRSMRRIAYPPAQLAAGIEGVVYVKAHVNADGTPAPVRVERVDPPGARALADAATAGVTQWRFNPAESAGKSVASDEIIPVVFSLRPDKVPPVAGGTLDAIRVSPPDEARAASADRPPSEDITFRKMYPPKYPEQAIRDKKTGRLQFKVLVDEHGTPQSVDVEHSEPPEAVRTFAQASVEAIMQWRFNPGLENGAPHAGYVLVPIDFALSDD